MRREGVLVWQAAVDSKENKERWGERKQRLKPVFQIDSDSESESASTSESESESEFLSKHKYMSPNW